MANPKFTKPELYLLSRWKEVHQLELKMKQLRLRYCEVFEEVLERVSQRHKELDCYIWNCDKMPKDESPEDLGLINVGIYKEEWPSGNRNWPTGFWIAGVLLEELHSESGDPPSANIWIAPPEGIALNMEIAASRVKEEAKRLWGKVKITSEVDPDDETACISYVLPQSRNELVSLLLRNNDDHGFIDCMVGHFETLAKLTNVLDDVLQVGNAKGKKRR